MQLEDIYIKHVLLRENVELPQVVSVIVVNSYQGGPNNGEVEEEIYDAENSTILVSMDGPEVKITVRDPDFIRVFNTPLNSIQNGVVRINTPYQWDEEHQAYNGLK